MTEEITNIHAIFAGKVQGVGFRMTVKHYAVTLGIHGTVSNLPDGRVEVFAQGDQKTLDRFVDLLKTQAGNAHVESVSIDTIEIRDDLTSFRII